MTCLDGQIYKDKKKVGGCLGLGGREEWGKTANGYGVSFGDNKNVLTLDCDGCTTLGTS